MKYSTEQSIQFDHVADLYDSYVRAEFDIPFWLKEARTVGGKVLELTCGTGRVSIPLLKARVDLTCVDYAPAMLAVLRGKLEANGLSCPIYSQDMAELSLPDRFDLIIVPFHSLSEVLERDRQRLVLQSIHHHLADGGIVICTLQNPAVKVATLDGRTKPVGEFPMEDGNTLAVRSRMTFNPATQISSGEQEYETRSSDGTLIERRSLNVSFYLFQKPEFERLAQENGFEVLALYGDYEYHPFQETSSAYMIWKLKKEEM